MCHHQFQNDRLPNTFSFQNRHTFNQRFHFVWLDLILNLNDALFSHHYSEKRKVFGVPQMAKLWNVAHSKYFPLSIQFIFWLTKSDELSFNCLSPSNPYLWLSQWNSFLNSTGLMWYVLGNVFHSSYLQSSCTKLWSDEKGGEKYPVWIETKFDNW